jgi:hypothetical protein
MRKIVLAFLIIIVSVSFGFAASLKVSELTETQTLTDDDLFLVSTYSGGSYTSQYIKKNYLVTTLGITNNAATMTVIDTTDASTYVALFDSATGDLAIKTDTKITFDATTGILTASGFIGPLTGAVTGNAGTATALAANPTDCSEGELATAIDASGNLTCGKAIGTDVQAYDSALTSLSSKVFAKTALTGAGGLDTVLYADLADGDIGMVGTVAGVIYWYIFEASSATAESSPSVIAPDDAGANNGRWLLKLYCDGSSCSTVQGATGASSKWLEGSANGTDYMQLKVDDDVGTNRKIVLSSSVSNSEDLSIQLGANDNTVTIASSTGVSSIGFGAIGLATTGTVSGGSLTPVIGDADDFDNNFTGANLYGGTYIVNAAGSVILANSTVGVNFTILLEDAVATVIEPLATGTDDTIVLNGTALTQGQSIQSSTKGAMCVIQYRAADSWMATCNGFIATP